MYSKSQSHVTCIVTVNHMKHVLLPLITCKMYCYSYSYVASNVAANHIKQVTVNHM